LKIQENSSDESEDEYEDQNQHWIEEVKQEEVDDKIEKDNRRFGAPYALHT